MLLTRDSENAWYLNDDSESLPRFRAARDYLTSQKSAWTPSAVLFGNFSPPSALTAEDHHRSETPLRFTAANPVHYSERYLSKRRHGAENVNIHGWKTRLPDVVGPPAIAVSSAWESFGSDSCSSLASSPLPLNSEKGSTLRLAVTTKSASNRPEPVFTVGSESSDAGDDARRVAGGISLDGSEEDGFCFSNVSDTIDKLINDSLHRHCKDGPPDAESKSSVYNLEESKNIGNFRQGPPYATSEGWAAAAAAAAFAAASISHRKDLQVGLLESGTKTDLKTGITLEPEEVDAFIRAKCKTEEVAARIRKKVTAAREARTVLGYSPQPRLSHVKLSTRVPVAAPSLRVNRKHGCTHSHLPPKTEIPSRQNPRAYDITTSTISSSSNRTKGAKVQPKTKSLHLPARRKTKEISVEQIAAENFLAVGVRLQPENSKRLHTSTESVAKNCRRTDSDLLSRSIAGVNPRPRCDSDTFHRSVETSVAPAPIVVSEVTHVVSNNGTFRRSPPIAEMIPYEKPLVQALTGIGDSRSPMKAQHSVYIRPSQDSLTKRRRDSKAYPASAPISPISDVARGNRVAPADGKSSGISTDATATALTATTQLAVRVKEGLPQVCAVSTGSQRVGKLKSHTTVPLYASRPTNNESAEASTKLPQTAAANKPSVPSLQPAALRHLARVMWKAVSKAFARELRNSAFAFFRSCFNGKSPKSPPSLDSVAPGTAAAPAVTTPPSSQNPQSAHGMATDECEQNSSGLYNCFQAEESCEPPASMVRLFYISTHCGSKCTTGALQTHEVSSGEQPVIPSLVHPNDISARPTSDTDDGAASVASAANSSASRVEYQENRELPLTADEPEDENVASGVDATHASQPVPACSKAPIPIYCENVPDIADKTLTETVAVQLGATEFFSQTSKVQQQHGYLLQPLLYTSRRKPPMEAATKLGTPTLSCGSATCRRLPEMLDQHKLHEPRKSKEQDNQIQEPRPGEHLGEAERREQGNELTEWPATLVHEDTGFFSCPATPQRTAVLRLEHRACDIEGQMVYHEVMASPNRQISRQLTALTPRTLSGHESHRKSQRQSFPERVLSSHRFPCAPRLQQRVSQTLSSACPSRGHSLNQSELLDVNGLEKRRNSLEQLATTSTRETAIPLGQKNDLVEEYVSNSMLSTLASPEGIRSQQISDNREEKLVSCAEGIRLISDRESVADKLRQQLAAERQSFSYQFRLLDTSRTEAEARSIPLVQHPTQERPVEAHHDRLPKQEKLHYEEPAPETPMMTKKSRDGQTRKQQEDKTHEEKQEGFAYEGSLGSNVPLAEHAGTAWTPQQRRSAIPSCPHTQAQSAQHQELEHQAGQTSFVVHQVLRGLVDRMEYFKQNFASAQHLQSFHVTNLESQHRPLNVEQLSRVPKTSRNAESHNEGHSSNLLPMSCQHQNQLRGGESTQLCIVGKSMANDMKHSSTVLSFPTINDISTSSLHWRNQHKLAPEDKKLREDSGEAVIVAQKLIPENRHAAVKKRDITVEKPVLPQSKKSAGIANKQLQAVRAFVEAPTTARSQIPEDNEDQGAARHAPLGLRGRRLRHAQLMSKEPSTLGRGRFTPFGRHVGAQLSTGKAKKDYTYTNSPLASPAISRVEAVRARRKYNALGLFPISYGAVQSRVGGQNHRQMKGEISGGEEKFVGKKSSLHIKVPCLKLVDLAQAAQQAPPSGCSLSCSSEISTTGSHLPVDLTGASTEGSSVKALRQTSCSLLNGSEKFGKPKCNRPSKGEQETGLKQNGVALIDAPCLHTQPTAAMFNACQKSSSHPQEYNATANCTLVPLSAKSPCHDVLTKTSWNGTARVSQEISENVPILVKNNYFDQNRAEDKKTHESGPEAAQRPPATRLVNKERRRDRRIAVTLREQVTDEPVLIPPCLMASEAESLAKQHCWKRAATLKARCLLLWKAIVLRKAAVDAAVTDTPISVRCACIRWLMALKGEAEC
ncbi:uncharacterized protein EMH_0061680 [Eimeria mitis]|uniref:Uncharacterized protein n=1 Tax=Eimeria mitis TaxID=44415 RepID=U6KM57_9EIME|nr:uncharacterized protein EMH_0061680 [Eimeria mitis]CDJ36543.1 hypothetical protein, conserved [Eimeria mitis]